MGVTSGAGSPLISRITVGCLLGTVLASSLGCGSPLAPSSGQVAGAWIANATLVSVSGGECVGSALQGAVGSRDIFTTALKQTGTALVATVASQGNGTTCAYAGTVGGAVLTLDMTSCQSDRFVGLRCGNGELRDLRLVSGAITAQVNAQVGTGTDRSSWNVLMPGTTVSVGTLTLAADFQWIFVGLPASDYHVFTGTVFPGYADGTISIPADPNPFCDPCGWFVR
jgi:hypothetical protein